jgi:hypothetical protein
MSANSLPKGTTRQPTIATMIAEQAFERVLQIIDDPRPTCRGNYYRDRTDVLSKIQNAIICLQTASRELAKTKSWPGCPGPEPKKIGYGPIENR